MPFTAQTMFWPGTRAILLVHGIGDASTGKDGAFPIDVIKSALGTDAEKTAIYRLNYDFINDWAAQKVQFGAGISALTAALKLKIGNDTTSETIADYVGDVLWPLFSEDIRFAVRDAFLAQLEQMQIDRGESALRNGDDPLDYQITIIAHSLGCFHTYEVLAAAASESSHHLRPASDVVTFTSVILMASPVQLIRTLADGLRALIPGSNTLATLSKTPLAIPAETRKGGAVKCTKDFVSITGNFDPVGGHLLGKKLAWAYMNIPGQRSIIVPQKLLNINTREATALALAHSVADGGPSVNDPHSWSAYIETESGEVRRAVLA